MSKAALPRNADTVPSNKARTGIQAFTGYGLKRTLRHMAS